jgi:hypothetical protein
MKDARLQIKASHLEDSLSWIIKKADAKRTVLKCRGKEDCDFHVRISAGKTTRLQPLLLIALTLGNANPPFTSSRRPTTPPTSILPTSTSLKDYGVTKNL